MTVLSTRDTRSFVLLYYVQKEETSFEVEPAIVYIDQVPLETDSPYQRADVKLELLLPRNQEK